MNHTGEKILLELMAQGSMSNQSREQSPTIDMPFFP